MKVEWAKKIKNEDMMNGKISIALYVYWVENVTANCFEMLYLKHKFDCIAR